MKLDGTDHRDHRELLAGKHQIARLPRVVVPAGRAVRARSFPERVPLRGLSICRLAAVSEAASPRQFFGFVQKR